MELKQKIEKMTALEIIKLFVAVRREIEHLQSELDSKENDTISVSYTHLTLPTN